MKVVLALAMGAAALAPNQPQVAGKVAARAAPARRTRPRRGHAASSKPAFAAPGDSIRRTEPVARKEARRRVVDHPTQVLVHEHAVGGPRGVHRQVRAQDELEHALPREAPETGEEVAGRAQGPRAGGRASRPASHPGLYSALSGLPMGETTPFLGAKPAEPPADDAAK